MGFHKDKQFSTHDEDNDGRLESCADSYRGGWWYGGEGGCFQSNLNGVYATPPFYDGTSSLGVIAWISFRPHGYSMQYADMKLRPT